jgi:hypothetical protein
METEQTYRVKNITLKSQKQEGAILMLLALLWTYKSFYCLTQAGKSVKITAYCKDPFNLSL